MIFIYEYGLPEEDEDTDDDYSDKDYEPTCESSSESDYTSSSDEEITHSPPQPRKSILTDFSPIKKLKNNKGKQTIDVFDFDDGVSKGRVLENQERDKCHKNDEIPGIYSNILSDH